MPMHDWSRLTDGLFRDFHTEWMTAIKHELNDGLLPPDYYSLVEQVAGGVVPDMLALHTLGADRGGAATGLQTRPVATAEIERSRLPNRRGTRVVVRHVSDNRPVAIVEVVSASNKRPARDLAAFVRKAEDFLRQDIHLLILDVLPTGPHDPNGRHGAIWQGIFRRPDALPMPEARTFAAYESDERIRAYVEHRLVGEALPDMPLFLDPDQRVTVPVERTYQAAYGRFPARWRSVLEADPTRLATAAGAR